jgi:Uma2 family endonuclease
MEKQMSTSTGIRVTSEEYLRLERLADTRSEYFEGEIIPMPGVTREHNLINGNLVFELKSQLSGRPCEVYFCEMRVKVPVTGSYAYPDVAALCGEPVFEDAEVDTLLNPQLLIEILSESTERHDRGLKLRHYRSIETLQEYVLVSQTEPRLERYTRGAAGDWTYSDVTDPVGVLGLSSIACRLSVARVYDRIFLQA